MDCIHVRLVYVRLGLVPGRHPKINLFGLHCCVICCEVETKLSVYDSCYTSACNSVTSFESTTTIICICHGGGEFLKKLWCCIGGKYNKINWFYLLG